MKNVSDRLLCLSTLHVMFVPFISELKYLHFGWKQESSPLFESLVFTKLPSKWFRRFIKSCGFANLV